MPLVIADDSADPKFVAADLLSQAEHGPDSQVVLITNSENLVSAVTLEIDNFKMQLSRKEIIEKSLQNSVIFLVKDVFKKDTIEELITDEIADIPSSITPYFNSFLFIGVLSGFSIGLIIILDIIVVIINEMIKPITNIITLICS